MAAVALYLCHELITCQGGRIWVESDLGNGSTFCFTLPAFSFRGVLLPFIEENQELLSNLAIITVEVLADLIKAIQREIASA